MPRTTTVTVNDDGSILLPPQLRRQFPCGSRFSICANKGTILLKEVSSKPQSPTPPKTREEAMRRVMEISNEIARDFSQRGITEAHIRRRIKKLRAERRAQGSS